MVRGRVQGVSFRAFVEWQAEQLGLTGYVRNLPGGDAVEAHAEGDRDRLEQWLERVRRGPRQARVDSVEVEWSVYEAKFKDFSIIY